MPDRSYRYLMQGAWRQIWRYRLRSVLVMSCAALGVAGAVAAVNFASGGRAQVLSQIQRLGTDLVIVTAQQSRAVAGRARTGSLVTTLVEADYRALKDEIPGLERSSALVAASLRLKAGYLSKVATVQGVEPGYFPMKAWELAAGEAFSDEELRKSARVALLGWTTAAELYPGGSAVGERIFINRVPFEVVGVLRERGPSLDGTNEDEQVFVPLTTAMRRLLNQDHYTSILLEVADASAMPRVSTDIEALLRTRHRISDFRPADFQVQTQTELIRTQLAAADRLGFLVRWIGLSGLLVSGLGILAIAWIAVRDRTTEIGTRRALGARAPHVFFQFAFEATVLAVLGAATGLGVGWVASRITARQAELPFVFDVPNAILALGVALLLNFAFASAPALRAARMDPIRALKHE